jgi:D-glycero-D-manno-heptose 1,7-bisphosphate phosphatase
MNSNRESKIENRKSPVVFFDRDGTLMDEVNFCNDPADVRAIPGVKAGLARLRELGWSRVIITNQSGIPRGRISLAQYEAVHGELLRQLDGEVDGTYFSADLPDSDSPRRKPGTGLLEEAARDLSLDLTRAYFVGDKAVDIACGHNGGMPGVLVLTGHGEKHRECGADFVARDVNEAIAWILGREAVSA